MGEYLAIPLIDAINKEREKAGKHSIPSSDDMCVIMINLGDGKSLMKFLAALWSDIVMGVPVVAQGLKMRIGDELEERVRVHIRKI